MSVKLLRSIKSFVFLILFLPMLVNGAECTTFTDIDSSRYKSDILYASDKGWVSCREGEFNPYTNVSRREAIKMALVAGGHNPQESDARECFDDISLENWSKPYICYAKDHGIISDEHSSFRPADEVSFQEAAKMILRSMTSASYANINDPDSWGDPYLEKMSYYGFDDDKLSKIARDYFVHILRTIKANPDKQPEAVETSPSILSVVANPLSVEVNQNMTFKATLDKVLPSNYVLDLQFSDTPTVEEKLMSCSGSSCEYTRQMTGEGNNRPFRVNLKKDGSVVAYKDGGYSVTSPIIYPVINEMTLSSDEIALGDKLGVTVKLDKPLETNQKVIVVYKDNNITQNLDMVCSGVDCSIYPTINTIGNNQLIVAVVVGADSNKVTDGAKNRTYNVVEASNEIHIVNTTTSSKISPKGAEHSFGVTLSQKLPDGYMVGYELEGLTRGTFLKPSNSPLTCVDLECSTKSIVSYAGTDRAVRFAIFDGNTKVGNWKLDTYSVTEPTIIGIAIKPQIAMQGTYFNFDANLSESLPANHYVKLQLEDSQDDIYLDLKYVSCENKSCIYSQTINTPKYNRKVRFGIFDGDTLTPSG